MSLTEHRGLLGGGWGPLHVGGGSCRSGELPCRCRTSRGLASLSLRALLSCPALPAASTTASASGPSSTTSTLLSDLFSASSSAIHVANTCSTHMHAFSDLTHRQWHLSPSNAPCSPMSPLPTAPATAPHTPSPRSAAARGDPAARTRCRDTISPSAAPPRLSPTDH